MVSYSLKKIVTALFGLLVLLTISSFLLLAQVGKNTHEQNDWVLHTHEVIEESGQLLSHMVDAETGQRGFLLTHQRHYLEPYNTGISEARQSLNRLRALTIDNDPQQLRLNAIEKLMSKKFDELRATIELIQNNKGNEALTIVKSDVGKQFMDNIRDILRKFTAEEQRLLVERKDAFDKGGDILLLSFALAALLILSVIFLIAYIFVKRLVKPILDLTDEVEKKVDDIRMDSDKEKDSAAETGLDEMSTLAAAFGNMHQKINQRTLELQDAKLKLEKQNTKLSQALENANVATKAKSDFLANMSHEIRTPINAVIGLTHLAQDVEYGPQLKLYHSKVLESSKMLLAVINDILDISKIEANMMELNNIEFDLAEVMHSLASICGVRAGEKDLELVINVPPSLPILNGDADRLEQVLLNLVNNAVKFTDVGSVTVDVEMIEESKEEALIGFSISDTGIGMDEAQSATIFEAFTQSDSSISRLFGGTGLGLTISKQIVELMDGHIWVKSNPGKGSSFHFTARFRIENDLEQTAVLPEQLAALRLLVVDDNPVSRKIISQYAERHGFRVTGVNAVDEATDLMCDNLESDPYGLVICDWTMAKTSGLESLQQLRENMSKCCDVKAPELPPVILTASYNLKVSPDKLIHSGVSALLHKPVSNNSFKNAVSLALGLNPDEITHSVNERILPEELVKKLAGIRMLVVEDNDVNQMVAEGLLTKAGISYSIANNGKEAIESLKNNVFDGVLMDVRMPVMDGLEATKIIRETYSAKELPIIAMTAQVFVRDVRNCLQAGMNDHIAKPINPMELYIKLDKWISDNRNSIVDKVNVHPEVHSQEHVTVPSIAGIDTEDGMMRAGDNEELYIKILVSFHAGQEFVVEEIRKQFELGDINKATSLIHTLKGSAGNIGAKELYQISTRLEHEIRDHHLLDEELSAEVEVELGKVISEIKLALADGQMG